MSCQHAPLYTHDTCSELTTKLAQHQALLGTFQTELALASLAGGSMHSPTTCCMALCLYDMSLNCCACVQVVGVNDWDTDVVTIHTSDDSAQDLPLVHDVLGCPGLQVDLTMLPQADLSAHAHGLLSRAALRHDASCSKD